ncbi:hypothetical protein ACFHW2_23560 [Actinomadura sp. LOL_016]|uniref:hypothetical protein n=1 Tax=unclassified Actinomadura TaxID=2626254 RepID=UPI003A80B663
MPLGYGNDDDLTDETTYERVRAEQSRGLSRRGLLRLTAGYLCGSVVRHPVTVV